jgi:hypothetical protein
MSHILKGEEAATIHGVEGRRFAVIAEANGRIVNQTAKASREYKEGEQRYKITVKLRFDDQCKNGHETFAITADIRREERGYWREDSGGCCHDEIAKRFPELAHLIKWHLVSTDGPLHYVGNTLYHAGDRDHNGLRKGEFRQLTDRKTGLPSWEPAFPEGFQSLWSNKIDAAECPAPVTVHYRPWGRTGEGKAREFDHARSCAVWPEATDEELAQEPEALKAALEARLPDLLARFKADMLAAGFIYPEAR